MQHTPRNIKYFKTPADFHRWLETNHGKVQELWIGFYKKSSGKQSITYPEALDEALCYGWIDGVRKSVDQLRYTQRFTPRKPTSVWSLINIKRVGDLQSLGRMMPPGIAVFEDRNPEKSLRYSYERETSELDRAFEREFRGNKKAWAFFAAQAPWYRRTATFWVVSTKREETRKKRLHTLIEDSVNSRRLKMLTSNSRQ